ncbi:hypothetical protein V1477_003359 [Vespula maculifrons]|uniref:Uncharacterized protein n=1 Tax=Vespula maculifrons TaxID=7453 RepID=A0ABD2CUD6_VESMC
MSKHMGGTNSAAKWKTLNKLTEATSSGLDKNAFLNQILMNFQIFRDITKNLYDLRVQKLIIGASSPFSLLVSYINTNMLHYLPLVTSLNSLNNGLCV